MVAGTLAALGGMSWAIGSKVVMINVSDSLPKGLYVRTFGGVEVGSIVAIPTPQVLLDYMHRTADVAIERGQYDAAEKWRFTADWLGKHPLLKPVIADAGDVICRDPASGVFTARGEQVGIAQSVGPGNVDLPYWSGCIRLKAGQIAVGSGRIDDSIDSRYFGAVQRSQARAYIPLWTD